MLKNRLIPTLALIAGVLLTLGVAAASAVKDISSREASQLIGKNRNIFVLDVRTPDEYRQAHLKNAVLIPINEMERRIREVPKNRPVLVYCAVGSRSASAAGFLGSQGYREVYNIADGIVGWYRNGLPVVR